MLGCMQSRMAMNMAQNKIVNLLKPFFAHQFSLVFVYLMCGLRQLFFFQCGPETPKVWTPLLENVISESYANKYCLFNMDTSKALIKFGWQKNIINETIGRCSVSYLQTGISLFRKVSLSRYFPKLQMWYLRKEVLFTHSSLENPKLKK